MWQCLNPHVTYSSTNGKGKIHMQKRKTNRVKFPPKKKGKDEYNTKLPSSARIITPAPACPGFPFEAPSNSRVHER